MEEEKKLRKTVEGKWASHLPELDWQSIPDYGRVANTVSPGRW
jgi:hypothetical protein